MSQRVAVITGAAGGIGGATAALFRREGWYVIGLDRVDARGVDRYVRADHALSGEIEEAFDDLNDVARIDALVNNAAVLVRGNVVETTPEDWDLTMATNIRAAYLVTRLAHRSMRVHGGAIVNVASVHAMSTSPGMAAYAASKAALVALTRASALDLAVDGIRANAVLPGAIDTPMLLADVAAEDRTRSLGALGDRTPLGRVGRPEEIAEAILFLADNDRSSFITGQTLVVDGGATARLSTE